MPVIFIFSAIVSGVALMLILYVVITLISKFPLHLDCLDAMGKFLFYALVVDFTLESLDWFHRFYEAEESIDILVLLVSGKLFLSLVGVQLFLGTISPLMILGTTQIFELPKQARKIMYSTSAILVLIGVLAVRWNVVIGGQLFSKSLAGFTTYKPELIGRESLLVGLILLLAPFLFLWVLTRLLPTWSTSHSKS